MRDSTIRETTPLAIGTERFTCLWPNCEWFLDWNQDAWVAEHAAEVEVPAYSGDDPMGWVHGYTRAVVIAYRMAVEASLHAHMDMEHPDWTVEELERHAAAYSVIGLMGHG